MKHLLMDLYGVKKDIETCDDMNEAVNLLIKSFDLDAVMPVINIPYYYSEMPEDGGVSSFCLLDFGHITVHTFPFFGDCFIDIMYKEIDFEKAKTLINDIFKPEKADICCFDRDTENVSADFNPKSDFGPHVFASAITENAFSLGDIYEILETLPQKINMHTIMRPTVVTNKIENYEVISGLIIIAESHISLHYNLKTKKVYLDIYSCKFCDSEILYSETMKLIGKECKYQLISRGTKQEKIIKEGYALSYNGWRENV